MDLFDPGSGSQVHDVTPGILANELFWTAQLPPGAFQVRDGGRLATLRLDAQPLVDTVTFGGDLHIASQVDVDVVWRATGEPTARGEGADAEPTSPAAFEGEFAEADSAGAVRGTQTGFSFSSERLDADAFFAEMGRERNGTFLS